jgi:hypothetical protein
MPSPSVALTHPLAPLILKLFIHVAGMRAAATGFAGIHPANITSIATKLALPQGFGSPVELFVLRCPIQANHIIHNVPRKPMAEAMANANLKCPC